MTRYAAGSSVEDYCRACKEPRDHRVIAADSEGRILRVICGFCGSQHNFRGGRTPGERRPATSSGGGALVSERERVFVRRAEPNEQEASIDVSDFEWEGDPMDLEMLLRRIIREEAGLTPTPPADKWKGGDLVLKPGKPGLQEKTIPIDTFFAKIVMLRNRLRVLEQQINAADMPDELKLKLQGYITGCYGTLTTFNVLFADEGDRFKGSGGD